MAGTTIKLAAYCLFLSLVACDCRDERNAAPESRQPGLTELSVRVTWLGTELRIITYLYTRHRETTARAIILRAEGLGPNHPELIAARKEAATSLERLRKEASVFIKSIRLQQSAQKSLAAEIRPLLDDISNFPILQKKALAVDRAFREALALLEEIQQEQK